MGIKTVSILGCGWYGLNLAKDLIQSGFIVKGSVTRPEKLAALEKENIIPFQIQFDAESEIYDEAFFNTDLLIISIPPKRNEDTSLYPRKIKRIKKVASDYKVPKVLFISSTGVYGDNQGEVDEQTTPIPTTASGKAILSAEILLKEQSTFSLTILRFGGLIGPGRDPGRFFAGKKAVPNGKAPVNLIHLDDCVAISKAIIQKNEFGLTINLCAPEHPQKMDFYTQAAIRSGLEKPDFIPELNEWKIVKSAYVGPLLNYRSFSPLI